MFIHFYFMRLLGKSLIVDVVECAYFVFFFAGCCRIGVIRALSGIPGNLSECANSAQIGDSCRGDDSSCCQCCKLGQRVRSMIGIDECQPRAESATFGMCRVAFLCCCLGMLI